MKGTQLLRLYHEMVLIRRLEERAADLYQQGKIGGFLHLYIGQEAVASGVISARKSQDHVLTAYRDHGVAIACGMTASKQQVPHYYVTSEIDASALMALRSEANALLPEEEKLSVNDFLTKAAALACVIGSASASRFLRTSLPQERRL
jgi:TPP-dependent pyruvate/acetoin dehydrogenase alpha subunit